MCNVKVGNNNGERHVYKNEDVFLWIEGTRKMKYVWSGVVEYMVLKTKTFIWWLGPRYNINKFRDTCEDCCY